MNTYFPQKRINYYNIMYDFYHEEYFQNSITYTEFTLKMEELKQQEKLERDEFYRSNNND